MRQLYIVRHGIAVPHGASGILDDDRPLTPKGEQRMGQIGRALRYLELNLDRIVSSPLPRAFKTAEIIAQALSMSDSVESADALRAERSAASIHDWLATRTEDRLMIVGHNPGLSDLVGLEVTRGTNRAFCELRKGGIAALARQGDGGMILEWLARPRLLCRLVD